MPNNQTLSVRGMSVVTSSTAAAGTGIKSAIKKITGADISDAINDDPKKQTDKKNEETTKQKTEGQEQADTRNAITDALKFSSPLKDPNSINRWDAANPGKPVSQDELISKYGFSKPSASGGSATGLNSNLASNNSNPANNGGVYLVQPPGFGQGGSPSCAGHHHGSWGDYCNNGSTGHSHPGQGGGSWDPAGFLQYEKSVRDFSVRSHHGHIDGTVQLANGITSQQVQKLQRDFQQHGYHISCKGDSCTFTGKGHHSELQPKAEQVGALMSANTSKSSKETEPQTTEKGKRKAGEKKLTLSIPLKLGL